MQYCILLHLSAFPIPLCSKVIVVYDISLISLPVSPAVDEQNAQTQEQEGFILGLSTSEEGKELRNEDKISLESSQSGNYGISKGRSHRKGTIHGLRVLHFHKLRFSFS